MKLFQIYEQDLADLEQMLPDLVHLISISPGYNENNKARVQLRRVQKILSDIRWNYGPAEEVHIIPAGDST